MRESYWKFDRKEYEYVVWYVFRRPEKVNYMPNFSNGFKIIDQCGLKLVCTNSYFSEILLDKDWNGISFGLLGTEEQHTKFEKLCCENVIVAEDEHKQMKKFLQI